MKIVCLGDSLTYGYGVRRKECWVKLLGNKLGVETVNKGVNGDTTAGMLSRSYSDVLESGSTHVIIMGGTNDFLQGHPSKNVKDNIELLIRESIESKIQPILAIQIPIYAEQAEKVWHPGLDYDSINENIKSYREWATGYCSENRISLIDFYRLFSDRIKAGIEGELYIDGIHPTSEAHILMTDEAWELMGHMGGHILDGAECVQ